MQVYFVGVNTPNGKFLPAAYLLLPSKCEDTYHQAFSALVNSLEDVSHVVKFSADFERSVHNVVEDLFENATIDGCRFHYKQCVYKNMGLAGCIPVFNNVQPFRQIMDRLYALSFVHDHQVVHVYEQYVAPLFEEHKGLWTNQQGGGFREEVARFKSYYEKAWIGAEVRNRGRRNPTWAITKWNKFDQVMAEDFVLTNNGNEVFNSSWVPTLPKNATVWSVIKGFLKEEAMARVSHSEYIRDVHQSHNSSRTKNQHEKMRQLHSLCSKWDKSTVNEYLDSVIALI